MSKTRLERIISAIDHFDNPFSPNGISDAEGKEEIKQLFLEIAETHAADDQNINLASFVAEIKNL